MKSKMAFRFIGKLSNDATRCAMNISSGNIVCACIDAGISLIDMTSSIIAYSSECNKTTILREHIYESRALLDLMVDNYQKSTELEIERVNQLVVNGLGKLKLELSNEYEAICLHIESQKNQLIQDIEVERKRNQIIENVRLMIKDTLSISAETLEVLNKDSDKNKFQISSLEEQIRLSMVQYNKMIKLSN